MQSSKPQAESRARMQQSLPSKPANRAADNISATEKPQAPKPGAIAHPFSALKTGMASKQHLVTTEQWQCLKQKFAEFEAHWRLMKATMRSGITGGQKSLINNACQQASKAFPANTAPSPAPSATVLQAQIHEDMDNLDDDFLQPLPAALRCVSHMLKTQMPDKEVPHHQPATSIEGAMTASVQTAKPPAVPARQPSDVKMLKKPMNKTIATVPTRKAATTLLPQVAASAQPSQANKFAHPTASKQSPAQTTMSTNRDVTASQKRAPASALAPASGKRCSAPTRTPVANTTAVKTAATKKPVTPAVTTPKNAASLWKTRTPVMPTAMNTHVGPNKKSVTKIAKVSPPATRGKTPTTTKQQAATAKGTTPKQAQFQAKLTHLSIARTASPSCILSPSSILSGISSRTSMGGPPNPVAGSVSSSADLSVTPLSIEGINRSATCTAVTRAQRAEANKQSCMKVEAMLAEVVIQLEAFNSSHVKGRRLQFAIA